MADPRLRVIVEVTLVSVIDHDHDHWCNLCLLGTGIRLVFITTVGGRPQSMHTIVRCTECGTDNVTVSTDARHC